MSEPDSKTLIALLKERDKEVKNQKKKLEKLEERYIQKHRENSDLSSDRDALLSFTRLVLESQYYKQAGSIKFEELEAFWTTKDEEKQRSIRNLNQIASEEIQKLKSELSKVKEQARVKDMELKELKSLEENYLCTKSQADEMRGEIEYYEKEIESLRIENAKLKSNHDESSKNKTEALIAAMEQKTKETLEESKFHKMLADSQGKISELEEQLKNSLNQQTIIDNLENTLKEQILEKDKANCKLQDLEEQLSIARNEYQDHRKKAQKLVLEKDQMIDKLKLKARDNEKLYDENDIVFNLKLRINELEKAQSRESINLEYLKNIVMRFMEYMYAGNLKEANTLACVIYTVLEFSNEEIEIITKARQSKLFLKGVKGMFSSTAPGVGVSHNTLHTIEGRKRIHFGIEESKDSQP